jgi:hypothetical protein
VNYRSIELTERFEDSVSVNVKRVIKLLISKRMRYLLPEMAWTGISLAVYTGLLIPMISDTLLDEPNSQ